MSEPALADAAGGDGPRGACERLSFWACAALVVVAIWTPAELPLADLPQHTAQLVLWERLQDPGWRFADRFELDWGTPYLAYYVLGRALTAPLGVEGAVRCLVTLAALGLPLALRHLLRRRGGDPLLALLGFPLAFGFPLAMGFLNFALALPLALLLVAEAGEQAERPTRRGALALAALSLACFVAHALAWAAAMGVAGAGVCGARGTRRARLRAAAALAAALPAALLWVARRPGALTPVTSVWGGGPVRALQLPTVLLGDDAVSLAFGLAGVLALALGARRLSRDPARWAPAAAAAALFALAPTRVLGVSFVAQRLGVLVPLLLLVALDPAPASRRRRAAVALVPLLALAQVAVIAHGLRRAGEEGRNLRALAARVPEGALVLGEVLSEAPGWHPSVPAHDHLPLLVQRDRDVLVEPSFARHGPQLVRYRPGREPPPGEPAFTAARPPYTHALVRAEPEQVEELERRLREEARGGWRLLAEAGRWRLYARPSDP